MKLTAAMIVKQAEQVMREGAVILTAADFNAENNMLERIQLYFWNGQQAVMDIISKQDLLDNWPDEGVFALPNPAGDEKQLLLPVGVFECDGVEYIRTSAEDALADELHHLPSALHMEAVEAICMLKK